MKKRLALTVITLLLFIFVAACGQGDSKLNNEKRNEENSSEHHSNLQTGEEDEDGQISGDEKNANSKQGNEQEQDALIKEKVYVYFADDELLETYKLEVEIEAPKKQLAKKALETWIAGPNQAGLISLVPSDTKVESIEAKDDVAHVSFSKEFLQANVGSSGEAMLFEQLAMIMQQFDFPKTQILIEGEIKEELFGHMMTNEPFEAQDPAMYKTYE